MQASYPDYSLPPRILLSMLASFVRWDKRDFAADALALTESLRPQFVIHGKIPQPPQHGMALLVNHYSRQGFKAWWIALSISATIRDPIHWVVTDAWEYDDLLRSKTVTPVSRWLLRRIAHSYGYTLMPAMPPKPQETIRRASAVRSLLTYIDGAHQPIIGLAPEGADNSNGGLQPPPPGVGRLLAHLSKRGLSWAPVGIYEGGGALHLSFGALREPMTLQVKQSQLDTEYAALAMSSIAACLPLRLRGPYT